MQPVFDLAQLSNSSRSMIAEIKEATAVFRALKKETVVRLQDSHRILAASAGIARGYSPIDYSKTPATH